MAPAPTLSPETALLDALEAARFDQFGINAASTFAGFIQPCDRFFGSDTGRSDAADWMRTAYHDMATYNSADGTGGLDASIRFAEEQARAENAGDAFSNTMQIISSQVGRYISIADSIALAVIVATDNCGGPEIAFRGGRIDAGDPNAPGVHANRIIASLPVGAHSFGGVQHDPFPNIVNERNDTRNTESVAHFDSTFVTFDNNIAESAPPSSLRHFG
ncbi:heme peroxidase [Mycena albidolilacea]|uniref:Peroxidase n=1 Tax=Mycena albidolilacea TaxID=1033008 RepID=A0AAD7ED03_9AGAR|nr:heme peroxidase [Mycena albidolilacea]